MPLLRERRIEYLIPVTPSAAPTTQVQIILLSAPTARAMTPALSHVIVPIAIRVTIDLIDDFSALIKVA